jgi:hypothetical protein
MGNEMIDVGTPENQEQFVVKKWPVIICMLMNMVLFSLPWFWYQKEVAINDAYGRENLDSFNYIGEFAASLYLPFLAGIPLSLLYLFCLKRQKSKSMICFLATTPFWPLVVTAVLGNIVWIILIPLIILNMAIVAYAFLNMELLTYCCGDGLKKRSPKFLLVGYTVVFAIGTLIALPWFL